MALGVSGLASATNGYFAHGYGTKNKGLAGAGVALPQDALAMATNPAGIAAVGQRLDIDLALFHPTRQYTVVGDPSGDAGTFPMQTGTVESDTNYFLIPSLGYTQPIGGNMAWGIAIYGNGGMNTDYPAFDNAMCAGFPPTPHQQGTGAFCGGESGVDLAQVFVAPTFAWTLAKHKLALGASLLVAYQRFEAKGIGVFGDFNYSSDSANFSDNDLGSSTGIGVRLGITALVMPGLTLGAAYQPKVNMSEIDQYRGLFAQHGDFDIPSNWTVGAAWTIHPGMIVAFDVQGINYTDVAAISNPSTNPSQFGADNGPGFGWQDIIVYKLGYQWSSGANWTWRAGFSHSDQPVQSRDVALNIFAPGVVQDHYTLGFTRNIGTTSEVSLSAMYADTQSLSGPSALDPAQHVAIQMTQVEVELSYAYKF
jgi:long-chain fatty acid transport protein